MESSPRWLREWIESEREAHQVRWYEPAFVPGIILVAAIHAMVLRRPINWHPGMMAEQVAHLDHQVSAQVVSQPAALAALQRTWEPIRGEAFSRRQSLGFIKEAAGRWI